ncbi:hypothetical protein EYF80_006252 [Liparis tanakae]|uniref:Uncharacterized protein n=1 Tax=Liparis tanakae TaxID=230148 RepID=A0A4Z2J000_9TELE|nr:hypothetical protein EYF80_006252 [Liparis tanakae]
MQSVFSVTLLLLLALALPAEATRKAKAPRGEKQDKTRPASECSAAETRYGKREEDELKEDQEKKSSSSSSIIKPSLILFYSDLMGLTAASPPPHPRLTAASPPPHRRLTAASPPPHPRLTAASPPPHPRLTPASPPPHRRLTAASPPPHRRLTAAAAQQAAEGLPEGLVAEGVAGGVDGAVDVAEPVARGPPGARDAVVAEGRHHGHDVVRRPGEDEGQHDGQDGLGDPPLPRHHSKPAPLLRPGAGAGGGGGERRRRRLPAEVGVGRGVGFHLVVSEAPLRLRGVARAARRLPVPPGLRSAAVRLVGGRVRGLAGRHAPALQQEVSRGRTGRPSPAAAAGGQASVQADHDERRQVEGGQRGRQGDGGAGEQPDVALAVGDDALPAERLPAEDGGRPEDEGQQPGGADHRAGRAARPPRRVAERPRHVEVPVQADDQQVHDGGAARHVVHHEPRVAGGGPQGPAAAQQVERVQVDGQQPHRQVGRRQAQQEVVVDGAQAAVHPDGQEDQRVAEHRGGAEGGGGGRGEGQLSRAVRSRADRRPGGGVDARVEPEGGVEVGLRSSAHVPETHRSSCIVGSESGGISLVLMILFL